MALGQACFMLGMIGSGFLGCMGVWCLMFGGGEGKERVSGWLFRIEQERRVKKEKMEKKRRL